MGRELMVAAKAEGIDMSHVLVDEKPGALMGCFEILPADESVHYERSKSSFATQSPSLFEWSVVLQDVDWVHVTGITPLLGGRSTGGAGVPAAEWSKLVNTALSKGISVSCDLNHRPALGSIEELWSLVRPLAQRLEVLIFSVGERLPMIRW